MDKVYDIDVQEIRKDFPILLQEVNGYPLVYFDNAATTQKPRQVIDSLVNYYSETNANIHRGIHTLAEQATSAFENTRQAVQEFIGAPEKEEIIFTKGTSESLNLVANSLGRKILGPGDEVLVTGMEHHSNIVPWQLVCEQVGAKVVAVPIRENGTLDLDEFERMLTAKTRIVSVVYASNALGTINPIQEIIAKSHEAGAYVCVDGAQAAAHLEIDVKKLDCDFFALSAHKMYGPTGVGVLYGKRRLLEMMPPYQGGGEMISEVSFTGTTYAEIPYKFEAGTPNIADVVAFKEAIQFVNQLGKTAISSHEEELLDHATRGLSSLDRVRLFADVKPKVSVVSFAVEGMHHFDVGMLLDSKGIAVRTGHHCTQPLMDQFKIEGTIRASFSVYNTKEEIDSMIHSLETILKRS